MVDCGLWVELACERWIEERRHGLRPRKSLASSLLQETKNILAYRPSSSVAIVSHSVASGTFGIVRPARVYQ
jgi:hypothetical protein